MYHINAVDEVTQWQQIGTVEAISETFLIPVLEALLGSFPLRIKGFHADNGSEYINHRVAALLTKLHVGRFTKSRARHSNDNALVEGKNASVVRKWLGHGHIPARFAAEVHAFNRDWLSPFLNFHRPCLFPTETVNAKGRVRKRYRDADTKTPYEKFKSLPGRRTAPGRGPELPDARPPGPRRQRLRGRRSAEPGPRGVVPAHRTRRRRRGLNRPGPSRPRPVELWTSPSDRSAPCGPWAQPLDNAHALPTACASG